MHGTVLNRQKTRYGTLTLYEHPEFVDFEDVIVAERNRRRDRTKPPAAKRSRKVAVWEPGDGRQLQISNGTFGEILLLAGKTQAVAESEDLHQILTALAKES